MKNQDYLEVRNISKARLNNKEVKMFEVWEFRAAENSFYFYDKSSAPVKTANKNLISYCTSNQQ